MKEAEVYPDLLGPDSGRPRNFVKPKPAKQTLFSVPDTLVENQQYNKTKQPNEPKVIRIDD